MTENDVIYAVMLSTPIGALYASSVFMSVQTTSAMSLIVTSVPTGRQSQNDNLSPQFTKV